MFAWNDMKHYWFTSSLKKKLTFPSKFFFLWTLKCVNTFTFQMMMKILNLFFKKCVDYHTQISHSNPIVIFFTKSSILNNLIVGNCYKIKYIVYKTTNFYFLMKIYISPVVLFFLFLFFFSVNLRIYLYQVYFK